ncbi:hypothetical protein LTR36_006941 [Oleoguttula mirabilis]|uniref:Ribosomal protein L19 n=1 Tax=Oleoguttula mirabilis TaxID=1507867 RepID=A0AAV9JBV2_9PEZI|nr:hypothetical protein LTR36_006941 [Oleoguttula mirabilis]
MSLSGPSIRPLAGLKQALRQCRAERQQWRQYATTEIAYPSLQTRYPPPSAGFRTSHTTKQNRIEVGLKKIPVVPPPRSTTKACPDPIAQITQTQLTTLDPSGARTRLFSPTNPERAQVGDILLVRLRSGDPFSGTVLNIRQRHSPIDTAILLRNQLTRVGVEMWFKVYSPSVEGVEVVQRKTAHGKRARRAKLYFLRQARHDPGSVEGVVKQYLRSRAGGPGQRREGGRGGQGGGGKKGGNKKR